MKSWKEIAVLGCVSFFGTGLISKRMPGTIGSFFASISLIFIQSELIPYFFIIFFALGLYCCFSFFKQKNINSIDKDPGFIVIDEVCGIYCCGIFLAIGNYVSLIDFAISFVLFRLFDILKPWPIRQVEQCLKRGKPFFRINTSRVHFKGIYKAQNRNVNDKLAIVGIMIDDIMAAVYAILVHAVYIYLISI
ncbi:MAG: phosphatidylglycerophosphatase A [Holosporales bacterium]|jgi:phosphatidylglycerophosphatase A|nr:phosphatidylglycerophosphatase A [Holosporales bacterium]